MGHAPNVQTSPALAATTLSPVTARDAATSMSALPLTPIPLRSAFPLRFIPVKTSIPSSSLSSLSSPPQTYEA